MPGIVSKPGWVLAMLAAALAFGSAEGLAQDGDLSGVTMRVVDDIRDIDAVVIVLEPERRAADAAQADAGDDRLEQPPEPDEPR